MNNAFTRLLSSLLIVCMIGLPFNVNAGLIGTDQIVAAQAQAARDKVLTLVSRADVAQQLQTMGLTPLAAKERVDSLTDSEVAQIAGHIEGLPAGADGTGAAIFILALLFFWWLWTTKK